jgi:DNA-binding GntR family transcriptional regulator
MPQSSPLGTEGAAPTATQLLAVAEPSAVPTRTLLREEVYARVRGWIVDGLLPPETRLRDKEIADALGVSRTPVREAIRRLQDEGLVVAEASRWTKVAPVDTETADHLYPIIWTLERLAVTSSGNWTGDRLSMLRTANDGLADALRRHDARAASEADTAFHRAIVAAAGNRELTAIMDDLKVRLRRIEIAYFGGTATADRSVSEHERVVAALEAGDTEGAGRELVENWQASLARLHERRGRG